MLGCVAGAVVAAPRAGLAQALLPSAGADVRLGDMRQQFVRAFQESPPASVPGWTISPSIDVGLGWTDAVDGAAGGRRQADFFATVMPSVLIAGQSERVTGTLSFAPQFQHYLSASRQDSVSLNFTGQSLVTLVPDLLFVDLRGAGYTQSQSGGYASSGATNLGRRDQVQTLTFSIDPYLQHRFGGFGTAVLGYSLTQTTITGADPTLVSPFQPPVSNQSTLTRSLHAQFSSGEDFGRISFGGQVVRTDNSGSGVLNGAHRYTETVNLGYAVTRRVQVLGTIGHEDVVYRANSAFRTNGLTWDAKVRLLPNADSSITVGYGRHDGNDAASLDATYAPTARIRLLAQYSEAVSTGQEAAQQLLSGAVLNQFGVPVDPRSGLPIGAGSNFFGIQTSPARTRRLSLGASLMQLRDVFAVNLQRDETDYLTTTALGGATRIETSGISTGLSWQHEFSDALKGNLYLQYGIRDTNGVGAVTQQTVGVAMGLSYAFSQTLSGRAQYSYNGTLSGSTGSLPSYEQNLVTIGLHKSF